MAASEAQDTILSRLLNYCFLFLIASFGFLQIRIPLLGYEVVVTDILFLLTGGLFLAALVSRTRRIVWNRFYWFLLAYLIALLTSAAFSADRSHSFGRLPVEIYLICLCLLAVNVVNDSSVLRRSVFAWLMGTALTVLLGLLTVVLFYADRTNALLEYLTYHYGSVPVGDYPRITATFVSASMLCNYLNVGLVFALLAYSKGLINRFVAVLLAVSILIAAVFTISIGMGGLILAVGIWYWLAFKSNTTFRRRILTGAAVVAGGFLLISIFSLNRYPGAEVWYSNPTANVTLMPSARVLVWKDAFQTFLSDPITGNGLGLPVANVIFTNTDGTKSLLTDAHNSFLSAAAQNGLIGLAAFTAIIVFVLFRWIKQIRSSSAFNIRSAAGLAFLCSFVYQGLTGSFEEARHLWVLMGLFIAADLLEIQTDQNS